ncbi:hypothetical protein BAP_1687 [Bacillus sp. CN2]|nr:hypothetical protein BAP_1687 [Bacillus sp. CN2]
MTDTIGRMMRNDTKNFIISLNPNNKSLLPLVLFSLFCDFSVFSYGQTL